MRRYDTTFIINPQIGDNGIEASVKEISDLITSSDGTILRENRIGNRRLAYDIARQTNGYYVSLIYDAAQELVLKLDKHFTLGENYLRHLTIRYEGDPHRKTMTEVMMGFESARRAHEEEKPGKLAVATTATATPTTPEVEAPTPASVEVAQVEVAPVDDSPASSEDSTAEESTL